MPPAACMREQGWWYESKRREVTDRAPVRALSKRHIKFVPTATAGKYMYCYSSNDCLTPA